MATPWRKRTPAELLIDLYCRISQDYDGDGGERSVDEQEDDGRVTVTDHGHRVGHVFKDPARSAWQPNVLRPEWEELMLRLETGQADGVWVYDLSRFTRKPLEGERLLALADRGIVVLSEDSTYDITTADGRKQFRDAMNAAAFESDKISQRTSRGKRKKALRGRSNASVRGFATAGYAPKPPGWQKGDPRQTVSEQQLALEREVVRDATRKILAGAADGTSWSICRDLDARGIRTSTGKTWTPEQLRQMLDRPALAGLVTYRGDIVDGKRLPGEHALDPETWYALRAFFASRRRGRPNSFYLLSGLLFCGRCGGTLVGRPRNNGYTYPDGAQRREYWCLHPRPYGKGCGRLSIDWRYADAVVKAAVLKRLCDPRHAERLAQVAQQITKARAPIEGELNEAQATALALAGRLGRGEIKLARYDEAMAPLDQRIARLTEDLAKLKTADAAIFPGEDIPALWAEAEQSGNLEMRRRLVKRAFPKLTILPAQTRGPGSSTLARFDWDGGLLPI